MSTIAYIFKINFKSSDRKRPLFKRLFINGLTALSNFRTAKIRIFLLSAKKIAKFAFANIFVMETFIYNRPVKGLNFIGHRPEIAAVKALISQGDHIVMYEPPKAGKTSLLEQSYSNLRSSINPLVVAKLSFQAVRTVEVAACTIGSAVITSSFTGTVAIQEAVATYLSGSGFRFDPKAYAQKGLALKLSGQLDEIDLRTILALPSRMPHSSAGGKMVVQIEEFQNIMQCERGEWFCKVFEKFLSEAAEDPQKCVSWVFCGSMYNAMKAIFEGTKYFYKIVNRVRIESVDPKEMVEHVNRSFLSGGKVLDKELILEACQKFKFNQWYVNHYFAICDSLSRGYITNPVLEESMESLIAIHEPKFHAITNDLTTFQVGLLRAVVDGHKKFSSSEIIKQYGLNSSANVHRLKEALCKKEILTFNDEDEPSFIDPLFEYWVTRFFFEIKK